MHGKQHQQQGILRKVNVEITEYTRKIKFK